MYKDMKNESMQKVVKSKFTALCHLILIMLYSHVKMSPQEELGMGYTRPRWNFLQLPMHL